jgi:lysophospholipase L1-like esterase
VFVAGDSTAADYDADRAPRAGWGQALPLYLDEDVTVRNFAQSGRSTKTFMAEGWLDKIWAEIQPGDYLLVSFAHNDEDDDPAKFVPLGDVETPGTFQYNLQLFIDGAKARGAHPVIVASVERRKFATVDGVETGPALKTHKGYPEAAIELATSQDVPAVDLTSASLAKFTELGPEATKQWFMHLPVGTPNWEEGIVDNTHFQATGAIGVARMVANGMDTSGAWPAGVYTRRLGTDVPVSELTWR